MKQLSIAFVFIISFFSSKAQLGIGVKGGYSLSSFNATAVPDISYHSKSNFNAGLIFSIPMGKRFSLQPEVNYSGEGAGLQTLNETGSIDYQYLNFPVLLKYKAPFHVFFETGPQLGFLLGAKITEDGFSSTDIKSQTKSNSLAWVFGLGYQLPAGFGIDLRMNVGLSDVAKSGSNSYNDGTVKSNVFQAGVYFLLSHLFVPSVPDK